MHQSQKLDMVCTRPLAKRQAGWMVQSLTRNPRTWQLSYSFHWSWREAQPKWFRPCCTPRIMPNILYVLSCLLKEVQSGVALVICVREHSRAPLMTPTWSICAIPIPDPGASLDTFVFQLGVLWQVA